MPLSSIIQLPYQTNSPHLRHCQLQPPLLATLLTILPLPAIPPTRRGGRSPEKTLRLVMLRTTQGAGFHALLLGVIGDSRANIHLKCTWRPTNRNPEFLSPAHSAATSASRDNTTACDTKSQSMGKSANSPVMSADASSPHERHWAITSVPLLKGAHDG
jgi:hypothetical protein